MSRGHEKNSMNYYNEWDKFAAEWLKQLIKDGLIPDGEVDNRSIADVEPSELTGFTQCHFFAGIGGWSRALQLAGWSPDRPVWTGSPPCQSFSTAGKGKGKDDERHLWPVFFNLIRECQPTAVFGEQVAAAIRHGWLDDLQIDFEAEGYASGAVVLPAGGIGAYHKRDRLFFTAKRMANSASYRDSRGLRQVSGANEEQQTCEEPRKNKTEQCDNGSIASNSVADSDLIGHERSRELGRPGGAEKDQDRQAGSAIKLGADSVCLADPINERPQGRVHRREDSEREAINGCSGLSGATDTLGDTDSDRPQSRHETSETAGHRDTADSAGFWSDSQTIYCRDGKYRPIPTEPALFPLADGIPNRVGILRGAGNAIVPQAAAEIIKAVM